MTARKWGLRRYNERMKRIQIEIDDETDALLDAMISSGEASKEAVARRLIEEGARYGIRRVGALTGIVRYLDAESAHTGDGPPPDALDAIVGKYEGEAGDIDEIVYGR